MAQLKITFDNILNVPVGNPNSVSDWNTFFDLPNYGTSFTGVTVNGNSVTLNGGSDITLKNNLFFQNLNITEFWDDGIVVSGGTSCFHTCIRLSYFYSPYISSLGDEFFMGCGELNSIELPSVITLGENCFAYCDILDSIVLISARRIGNYAFNSCSSLTNIYIPLCTELGDTTGNNYVFEYINGNIIDLNISSYLMTVYSGQPDLDIQILQSNNTVTITNPISRPFAYNTGSTISGTNQYGDIAVGVSNLPYVLNVGGVQWWEGPDESLGYVIARPNTSGEQPNKLNLSAYITFDRSELNDPSFIELVNNLATPSGPFLTAQEARTWLFANGYWTSFRLNSISSGYGTNFYSNDGSLYGWGDNGFGQIGDNSTNRRLTPVTVYGGLNFSQISTGGNHTLGITTSGITYAWGDDTWGQLGINGDFSNRSTPVAVYGGLTFSQVSAGGYHSLGITTTGLAYAWGRNLDINLSPGGQLGNNTSNGKSTPVAVCGGLTFSQVSAGEYFSLGITTTGVAYAWGVNSFGELGDNTVVNKSTPIAVYGGLIFSQISAGGNHSLGLTTTGVAYAWGQNIFGQLGNNSTVSKSTPVTVYGGLIFSQVSSGDQHSLGITSDGTAYAWGNNSSGQLGDGTINSKSTPVAVCGGLIFSQVAGGQSGSLGITRLGFVYAWGSNFYGQIGVNKPLSNSTPKTVFGGFDFCQISAGYQGAGVSGGFSLGITTAGLVYAWGLGTNGVLGTGNSSNQITPVAVYGGLTFSQISAGRGHTLGITTSGIAYAWGPNAYGQLGDNTIVGKLTPIAVYGGMMFSQISAGYLFSLGLTTTGNAFSWGDNSSGQLGDNTIVSKSTPVAVCGGLTFSQLSAGRGLGGFSLGITTTGAAYAWGTNTFGQLGDNSTVSKITPIAVCGGLTFSQISAGGRHSLGLTTSGLAYSWGLNNYGQLGDNTIVSKITPVAVCLGLIFSQISAGESYCLGITTAGVAYAWGLNTNGELGDNTTVSKRTPVAVCGGLTFSRISAGNGHSLGITTEGVAYAWGINTFGQLGNGNNYFVTPTRVYNI